MALCQNSSSELCQFLLTEVAKYWLVHFNQQCRKTPDVNAGDIVTKHVSESTHNLVRKLRGGYGRRKRKGPQIRKKRALNAAAKRTKTDIFS
jgi:hypothetical protein